MANKPYVVYQLLDYMVEAIHSALQGVYTLLYKQRTVYFFRQKKYEQSHTFTVLTW